MRRDYIANDYITQPTHEAATTVSDHLQCNLYACPYLCLYDDNTLAGQAPDLSTSLNQYYSWPVDSSSGFPTGISHISLQPHKIQPRGWKKKNKQTNKDLGQLQAQEREFCDTLYSPSICRQSQACILRETSTKATRNVNSSLTVFPHHLLLLTILSLDCYLMPTSFFHSPSSFVKMPLCLFWDLLFFVNSLVSGEISSFGLLCGFCTKADKKILWLVQHTHPTQQMAT